MWEPEQDEQKPNPMTPEMIAAIKACGIGPGDQIHQTLAKMVMKIIELENRLNELEEYLNV